MNNENCNTCISKILAFILELQKNNEFEIESGCNKPSLGPNISNIIYNTRPINIYCCGNNNLWQMPYTLNGQEGISTVFKIHKLDSCCATFEILANSENPTDEMPYIGTKNYFTINLNCILGISCLEDTYIN